MAPTMTTSLSLTYLVTVVFFGLFFVAVAVADCELEDAHLVCASPQDLVRSELIV